MSVFLAKRLFTFLVTLAVASMLVFAVLELLPGNVAQVILGDSATPEAVALLQKKLGLDLPPLQRYADWIGGLLRGHTVDSFSYGTPTAELIVERLQVTLPLATMAMTLSTLLALVLGVYAASHHNRPGDVGVMALGQFGIAVPSFWFAILLILLFAVKLQWVSAGGFPGWGEDDGGGLWPGLRALLLPAIALAVVQAAILARVTRSSVLEVMREDYVRTARAKGLPAWRVIGLHALRNALIPVVTIIGLQVGALMAGAVLTETIFSWPGVGKWLIESISRRDYPALQGGVMLISSIVIGVNLLVDLTYGLINPRIRHG
jgi:peptide/nickel transport system permease protein